LHSPNRRERFAIITAYHLVLSHILNPPRLVIVGLLDLWDSRGGGTLSECSYYFGMPPVAQEGMLRAQMSAELGGWG